MGKKYLGPAATDPEDIVTLDDIGSGSGDVVGPASSTDNAIARYDADGQHIQNSNAILADSGDLTLVGNQLTVEKSDASQNVSITSYNSHADNSANVGAYASSAYILLHADGSNVTGSENLVQILGASNNDFIIQSDSDIHFYPTGASSPIVSISDTDTTIEGDLHLPAYGAGVLTSDGSGNITSVSGGSGISESLAIAYAVAL